MSKNLKDIYNLAGMWTKDPKEVRSRSMPLGMLDDDTDYVDKTPLPKGTPKQPKGARRRKKMTDTGTVISDRTIGL